MPENIPTVDILIPTYQRPAGLAVTLATLIGQSFHDYRVVISDQTDDLDLSRVAVVRAVVEILRLHGRPVEIHKHLPRRGLAEQRQFLLDQARAPYSLYLDDDIILEPDALALMVEALRDEDCGFVGCAVPSPRYLGDVRPDEQHIEFWEGPVQPETIGPDTPEWERAPLHSAANILHVADRLHLSPDAPRRYKVAWIGACVMFNTAKLRDCGGFDFWRDLPEEHAGEDVLAQMRVMARYGGCGIIPTRAYHQLLPTTVTDRTVDAPYVLPLASHSGQA